jgi:hypothetical protein
MLALLVGLGRLYMGAHYLSDVLAGWALGGLWASVCLTAAEVVRRIYTNGSRESNGIAQAPSPEQSRQPRDAIDPPRDLQFRGILWRLLSIRSVEPI